MAARRSGAAYYQQSVAQCFLLCCCIFVNPGIGYSLKNCTVRETLDDPNMKVVCTMRKLQAIPDDIPQKVRTLDISCNNIALIKKSDFKDLMVVNILNMSSNQICFVEGGAFLDLVTLKELNLADNKLTTLTEDLFLGLGNLSVLRLDNNLIKTIASLSFHCLSNLQKLNLTRNRLKFLKDIHPILQFTNLQELFIGFNRFTTFQSQEISNTSMGLQVLDVSSNPLGVFRITGDVLPHLQTLNLSFSGPNGSLEWDVLNSSFLSSVSILNLNGVNMSSDWVDMVLQSFNSSLKQLTLYNIGEERIKTFTDAACRIPKLRVLRLLQSNILFVSEEMLQSCNKLTELDLSNNLLTELSNSSFKSMTQLDTLNLGKNRLSSVPNVIRNLQSLHQLDLSVNNINKLHCSDFVNLTGLSILHIYHNKIPNIEGCVFQHLRDLKVLNIGTNKFLTLAGAFKNGFQQQLEILDLRGGLLETLSNGDFKGLTSLQSLVMYNNKISVIENGAFEGLGNLINLHLASNKITRVLTGDTFKGLTKLKELNLSSNRISYETQGELNYPPFCLLSSLEILIIFSQHPAGMIYLPSNFLKGLKSLLVFNAKNLNIRSLHPNTFIYTPKLLSLDISLNEFRVLSPEPFLPVPRLNQLFLSKAQLPSLDFLIGANLTQLSLLKVTNNALTAISPEEITSIPALSYIELKYNAFICDCSNSWFINWLKESNKIQVVYAYDYECKNPVVPKDTKLLELDTNYCSISFLCFISTTCVVLFTLIVSYTYHLLRWQVVYAYYLFLAYLHDTKRRKTCAPHKGQYDAFISYNAHDEPWVLRELLPKLEGEQGWRLCLHHRDFQPGKPIMDNITDAIYGCRKTICVISRRYLESEWCSREIQMANFRLLDEQKDVLILVFLEDIPAQELSPYHRMRRLVKKRTYLSWPRAGEHPGVFWEKLRLALETRNCTAEENPLLSGEERPL
ncbi:toll-like receptor 13 [Esox lucius]|nr:toll-like receptor 13 [Esox lucius]